MVDQNETWRLDPKNNMTPEKHIHAGKEWIRYSTKSHRFDFELRDQKGLLICDIILDKHAPVTYYYMLTIRNSPSSKLEISHELFDRLEDALDAGNSNYDIYLERQKREIDREQDQENDYDLDR